MKDFTQELRMRKEKAKQGGGPRAIARQHEKGKLTARERLDLLLDPGTFVEFGLLLRHSCTDFGWDQMETPGEGIVTGYGKIEGRRVFVAAQDFTAQAASIGEMFGKKLISVMDLAAKARSPLIVLHDSAGLRPPEQLRVVDNYFTYFHKHVQLSGVTPQISLIMGPCAGGQAYEVALSDFIFMVKGTSYLYIGGPPVAKAVVGENVTDEQLGGSKIHSKFSGTADLALDNDEQCLQKARELLSFLPSNNKEDPPFVDTGDDPDREDENLAGVLPANSRAAFDMREIITRIVDNGYFFELKPEFAKNLIVGFARLDGHSVGIVANQPLVLGGILDIDSSDKGARFIRFCDAFNIPILYLVDTPAFLVGTEMEKAGIIRHGAKILYATCEASVPKITLVVRKAIGGGLMVMGSKPVGGDLVFAWPGAEIAVFGLEAGMSLILKSSVIKRRLAEAQDVDKATMELKREYEEKLLDLYRVCGVWVDEIIEPQQSRPMLIRALGMVRGKQQEGLQKKHGNMPL